jgi:hypothetical protein
MKKKILDFDYGKFLSNNYEVTTTSGMPVYIAGLIDEGSMNLVIGKCEGRLYQWDENGTLLGLHANPSFNLILVEKPKKMVVSVVRSREGNITARVTEYVPYAKVGNEILAQYEFDVLSSSIQS